MAAMMRLLGFLVTWLACTALHTACALEPEGSTEFAQQDLDFFEQRVRPLLIENCLSCHDDGTQESGLRLDSRAGALAGGDRGPAIVPGDPAAGLLMQAVRGDGELEMPPDDPLNEQQIAELVHWIEIGAPWSDVRADAAPGDARNHWAFQPVQTPSIPPVSDTAWCLNPIDHFVLAHLEANQLSPSSPADRRTLIRRLSFDVTGLPPTPDEVATFVGDQHPLAHERLVERMLASSAYGEQWARHWLDVARYSDTKGYVYAREERNWVHAWAYRDWVVRALNDDMPYDQFVLLQVAADQANAPDADDRSNLAALGFLTIGRRFLGVSRDIVDDRIDVVTRGILGLTVACARCHDHKYDPIPTEDYYSLSGVFQSCTERLVRIDATARDETFENELAARQAALAAGVKKRRAEAAARARARVGDYVCAQLELEKYPEEGFDVVISADDMPSAFVRRWRDYLQRARGRQDPVFVAWHDFAELPAESFADVAVDVCDRIATEADCNPLVLAAFTQPPTSMVEVADRYGDLLTEIEAQWQAALHTAAEQGHDAPSELPDADAEQLRQVLYADDSPCIVPDEPVVSIETFFPTDICNELWKLQGEVERLLLNAGDPPAHALVLVDRSEPTTPRVLRRGDPRRPGEEVPRQFLGLLRDDDDRPFAHGSGRLELAQALVDPENPLTARVIVNRVWMHHFGTGLVETPSDFGTRAEEPVHLDLLDWLASRFIANGWSLKWLHRQILLSNTYRQSAAGPPNDATPGRALEVDPDARWLWRRRAHRLTFEELRDAALAATGELDPSAGGPPDDLFSSDAKRRSIYGRVDRQFLPATLRVFDFANPDLHVAQRSETTVPQQALFFLNDPFLLARARRLAKVTGAEADGDAGLRVQRMYTRLYQREPTSQQLNAALALVESTSQLVALENSAPATAADWRYGYAAFDPVAQEVSGFTPLPHFTGSAWQGGPDWPDAALGWVQLTAEGGHSGNDHAHAAVRRWVSPLEGTIRIQSTFIHEHPQGDGVATCIVSSRTGPVASAVVHNDQTTLDCESLQVSPGDTIDFVVDVRDVLNSDDFLWKIEIAVHAADSTKTWNAERDFGGTVTATLDPWEQLAQVLLATNEFLFVD